MKTILLFSSLFILCTQVLAQPLAFDVLGSDPAYCRMFPYQSGNGVVYAAGTGGTPPYTYQWKRLATGTTTTNATWGGLNPGEYEITLTDNVGAFLVDTIMLDSLNPVAAIGVTAPGLTQAGIHYSGAAPVSIVYENNSLNFANPNDVVIDTTFFWKMTQYQSWYVIHDVFDDQMYTYNYGGDWSAHLVAINKNGCTDTAVVYLHLTGPLELSEEENSGFVVWYNSTQEELFIQSNQVLSSETIRIYNTAGQLIQTSILSGDNNIVKMNVPKGVYLYEIVQQNSDSILKKGKISIP